MTQETRRPGCLDANMMAEYIDGGLEPRQRAEVEAHLAECEECYEVFGEAVAAATAADSERIPTSPMIAPNRPSRKRWLTVASAAAALILAVAGNYLLSATRRSSDMAELADALGAKRSVVGRLSGGFVFGPVVPAVRGSSPTDTPEVTIAIAHIKQDLLKNRTARNLQRLGIAQVLLHDADGAIASLEESVTLDSTQPTAWSDLGNAYLARAMERSSPRDLPVAFEKTTMALSMDPKCPEALFNLALVLEEMATIDKAKSAWQDFLSVDSKSAWANEARRHLDQLTAKPPAGGRDAGPLRDAVLDTLLPAWADRSIRGTLGFDAASTNLRRQAAALRSLSSDRLIDDIVIDALDKRRDTKAIEALATGIAKLAMGRAHYRVNKLPEAASAFKAADQLLTAANSPLRLIAEVYAATADQRMGNPVGGLKSQPPLLLAIRGLHYDSLAARSLWVLGIAQQASGAFALAARSYAEAKDSYAVAGEHANMAAISGQIASLSDDVGDIGTAWRARLDQLTFMATSENTLAKQGAFTSAALWSRISGWPHVALFFGSQAVEVAETLNDDRGMVDALVGVAQTSLELGAESQARAASDAARAIVDRHPENGFDPLRAKSALIDGLLGTPTPLGALPRIEWARNYYRSRNELSRIPEAIAAQGELLRLLGRSEDARKALFEALQTINTLAASSSAPKHQYLDRRQFLLDKLVGIARGVGRQAELFRAAEMFRGAASEVTPTSATTPEGLQHDLPPDCSILAYLVHAQGVSIWLIDSESVHYADVLVPRDQLSQLVQSHRRDAKSQTNQSLLKKFLLDPVGFDQNGRSSVAIVPDGFLYDIAFETLPGVRAKFLIEEHAIWYAKTAQAAAATARPETLDFARASGLFVGISPIGLDEFPNLQSLPRAADEARAAASAFLSKRTTLLIGAQATKTEILAQMQGKDILHFAGHALIAPIWPDAPLLLTASGPLTSQTLRGLKLENMQIAVLAACESADGLVSRSAGPLSLATALFDAGVHEVVATRWPLSDDASLQFFRTFYGALKATGDTAESIRRAQRARISASEAGGADPKTWAGVLVLRNTSHDRGSDKKGGMIGKTDD